MKKRLRVRDVLKVMAYNKFMEFINIPAEDGSEHNWFMVCNVPEEYLDLEVTGISNDGKYKNTIHLPYLPDPEWRSCIGIRTNVLLRKPWIEDMRESMISAGVYSLADIETIFRLEYEYLDECDEIAEECFRESGYPRGSNYELKCENVRKEYDEQLEAIDKKYLG